MIKLSPEVRRLVIQYAAKHNISFNVALECLLYEGVKALPENHNVDKCVNN